MKKTLAVTSATVVGVGLVATGGATPAAAADITVPCTSANEHTVMTGTLGDNWFMDCVPQYGVGKAEFTITSVDPFPVDFAVLDDPSVSSSYSENGPAAAAYFGVSGEPAGFASLGEVSTGSTPSSRHYSGHFILPIAGVHSILAADLPAACNAGTVTYANAYRIDYAPAATTFTQTAGGDTWTYEVQATANPLYLGLNFVVDPGNPVPGTAGGALDAGQPQCAVFNDGDVVASGGASPELSTIEDVIDWTSASDATLWPINGLFGMQIGSIARSSAPAANDEPTLAETGVDVLPGSLAGGAGILAGLGLFLLGRRLKRRAT